MSIKYGTLEVTSIRFGDGSFPRVYKGDELIFGEPPPVVPVEPYTEEVTIASGSVSADLTAFPYYIDLSSMSPTWWYNVLATGADIRAYDGSDNPLAFDLLAINRSARTGAIFVRTNIASASATAIKLEVGYPERTALPANDTYGQYAVWQDYEAVYFFLNDLNDRTDNGRNLTVKTGSANYGPAPLGAAGGLSTALAAFQASVDNTITPSAIYTLSASLTRELDNTENQQAMTFCQTFGQTTNRSTIGHRNTADTWTSFSNDDSWLDGPTIVLNQPHRVAATYNGSTQRRLFLDGAVVATDNTIVSKTMDTLTVGGGSSSGANWRGRIGFAYLRLEVMSAAWLEAEAANLAGELGNQTVQSLWVGATT